MEGDTESVPMPLDFLSKTRLLTVIEPTEIKSKLYGVSELSGVASTVETSAELREFKY